MLGQQTLQILVIRNPCIDLVKTALQIRYNFGKPVNVPDASYCLEISAQHALYQLKIGM